MKLYVLCVQKIIPIHLYNIFNEIFDIVFEEELFENVKSVIIIVEQSNENSEVDSVYKWCCQKKYN
jgi:hypothetical protein